MDAPRPGLILVNINLPNRSGIELLAAVNANQALRSIPVVMFTWSSLDEEKARCLALGAKGYIVKPMSYAGVLTVARWALSSAANASA